MTIKLYEVAKQYTAEDKAKLYFNNCEYNGTIEQCTKYLKQRQKVAEINKDFDFIVLVDRMINNGLIMYKKNNYVISFVKDDYGYIYNSKTYKTVSFLKYDNGAIVYDYPYQVPKYIKEYMYTL